MSDEETLKYWRFLGVEFSPAVATELAIRFLTAVQQAFLVFETESVFEVLSRVQDMSTEQLEETCQSVEQAVIQFENEATLDDWLNRVGDIMDFSASLFENTAYAECLILLDAAWAFFQSDSLKDRPELDAERADLYTNRGVVLYSQGQLDKALAAYQQALDLYQSESLKDRPELDAGRATLHMNRGSVLYSQGHLDKALAAYQQALDLYQGESLKDRPDLDAGRADLHMNRGLVLDSQGQLDKALVAYQQALDLYQGAVNFNRVVA
jgi:tetratricopeptide (TPR) repeat protein